MGVGFGYRRGGGPVATTGWLIWLLFFHTIVWRHYIHG